MPRKGYKCITITEKMHQEIQKKAKEHGYTMKKYIECLVAKDKSAKEGK